MTKQLTTDLHFVLKPSPEILSTCTEESRDGNEVLCAIFATMNVEARIVNGVNCQSELSGPEATILASARHHMLRTIPKRFWNVISNLS
jgi:hypothetical protein